MATAELVIENGVGYDPWVDRLLGASSVSGRLVLNVGDMVGVKPGGNPHRWYSPDDMHRVIAESSPAPIPSIPKAPPTSTRRGSSWRPRPWPPTTASSPV